MHQEEYAILTFGDVDLKDADVIVVAVLKRLDGILGIELIRAAAMCSDGGAVILAQAVEDFRKAASNFQ